MLDGHKVRLISFGVGGYFCGCQQSTWKVHFLTLFPNCFLSSAEN